MPSAQALTLNQALHALRLAVGTPHEDAALHDLKLAILRIRRGDA